MSIQFAPITSSLSPTGPIQVVNQTVTFAVDPIKSLVALSRKLPPHKWSLERPFVLKLKLSNATAFVYKSGKVVVFGKQKMDVSANSVSLLINSPILKAPKVCSIVGVYKHNAIFQLEVIYRKLNELHYRVDYEPELFPAMSFYTGKGKKTYVRCFRSGILMVFGVTNIEEANEAIQLLLEIAAK
jgi:TATA-box binding protein (TBP) (component of TFIID and TFIIIB)